MRRVKFALRCVFTAAAIVLVLRKVDWGDLGRVLSRTNLPLAATASLLTIGLLGGLALRWQTFLRQQKMELPFRTVFSLTWAGQFFNSLLPGSTGGDVFKIYQVCRLFPERRAAAAATVFIDRLSALVALVALAAIALICWPAPVHWLLARGVEIRHGWWIAGAAVILLAAGWIALRTFHAAAWVVSVKRTLLAATEHLRIGRDLLFANALAFAVHLLNFFIIYLFARALRLNISYVQVLLMMPVVLLLVMLPVTINGHGLRELLLIFYFSELGVQLSGGAQIGFKETAVALSVLIVGNDLIWSLPAGLRYLLGRRKSISGAAPAAAT